MENIKAVISANLVRLRKAKGITQQELAEQIDYSDKAVSRWERGEVLPDVETLNRICEYYEVRFEYLLQEEEPEKETFSTAEKRRPNTRIVISLIIVAFIWLFADVVFTYANLIIGRNAWRAFIWAIPATFLACTVLSAAWGRKIATAIFSSALVWTLILGVYIQLLTYNMWMLFLLGAPVQVLVILFASLKKGA